MPSPEARPSRLFTSLALATALLTVGLIVFGAVVRVTDSGLGCGNHWPLCNGTIFPPLDNVTAWIEWLHRLFAALIGVLGLATLFVAIRNRHRQPPLALWATVAAAILFVIQSALGAIVVILDLPPTTVTLHLGTAMLLLAALLVAAIAARYRPRHPRPRDNVTALAYITAALAFLIVLTGALVRGSGATLACLDWPLCNGELFPVGQGQLALIHMMHRFAVVALGLSLILLVWQAWTRRPEPESRRLALLAALAYLAQAGVGAMLVISRAAPVWGAGHVLFAALTWSFLVALCLVETLNSRAASSETEESWRQPHSGRVLS